MMLRNLPRTKYCGLTVILSMPSRMDKLSLLTAKGGILFNEALQPEYNSMQCDIRLPEDKSPLLEGTRAIVLLGEKALHHGAPQTVNNTIHEMRGSPLKTFDLPSIASYFPQDCTDIQNYEKRFNEQHSEYTGGANDWEDDKDEGDVKRLGKTKRKNYAFWLKKDIAKIKQLLIEGKSSWSIEPEPIYRIFPSVDEVVNALNKANNCFIEFDMETDYEEQNMLCFSFTVWRYTSGTMVWDRIVYGVPVLTNDYTCAYTNLSKIIVALMCAAKRNTIVAHNGAGFDFLVLSGKYQIPLYNLYDTMIVQHRIYPDVEKSLGHCVSLYTNQVFHKDQDSESYFTQQHMMDKLKYCCKDVFTMTLVHQAQDRFIPKIPGLRESVDVGIKSIKPYLVMMLQGFKYDKDMVDKMCKECDLLMEQYLRIINHLIGELGMKAVRAAVKGKAKGFANSSTQCVEYFHNLLGYPVMDRSERTNKPKLGKKEMYSLAIWLKENEIDNPVIRFVMLYRQVAKEYSALRFIPFRDDNNKIVNYYKYEQLYPDAAGTEDSD